MPQPARTKVTQSIPASPAKSSKGRATTTASNRTTVTNEKNHPTPLRPIPQPNVTAFPPTFSGNFDLYGMYLPFLAKICLPLGATTPNYSAVYDRILASQAKHDYTARCFLAPQDPSSSAPPYGRLESASVLDPMVERPFDITLHSFTHMNSLSFTPIERSSFQAPEHSTPGPGLVAHTGLSPNFGIKNAKGIFKIKRIWAQEQDGLVKELFEGFFSFSVSYDSTYRKADHSNGSVYKFAFWGVRAMKDNTGKEIGLGPRKIEW